MIGPTGAPVPCAVLGGSGYVAGELLRLLSGHPFLSVEAVVSESRAGAPIAETFPHLRGLALGGARFAAPEELARRLDSVPTLALFSALPHGEAAARIDALLGEAEASGCELTVVDLSADFRHRDPAIYESIYGQPHAAPARLPEFHCALPEHAPAGPLPGGARHVAHPGCFTTAAVLALAPLVANGLIEGPASVVAVTGSTGAGRTPGATTHHPERRSDLFAYAPFAHRHEPEMRALLAAVAPDAESDPEIAFLPHSGPFARGIHATITAALADRAAGTELVAAFRSFHEASRSTFVHLLDGPPRLQSVVGTNRCDLFVSARDGRVAVFAAIDNLVKGAAGGAVQWMNRLLGRPERSGLELPGPGWL
ncbi:MAG TPA: N-acetyl-gamma-glutamyl-phosphate reductase [Thermoanaerobaculia bacterium]|nr:N-acetyl-gamma-glutamyl-phosphate reductase [Thermoanaerobaculia bacterium]